MFLLSGTRSRVWKRRRRLLLASITLLQVAIIQRVQAPIPAAVSPITPEPIPVETPTPPPPQPLRRDWSWAWEGGNQSLLHHAIGAAEGTRGCSVKNNVSGTFEKAYWGHQDPGNEAWNIGTFSYQHGAPDPDAADAKQVERLKGAVAKMQGQAVEYGLVLTLHSYLNALDLWNQSPTSGGGTMNPSVFAASHGFIKLLTWEVTSGRETNGDYTPTGIITARTKTYLNPYSGTWTATGLDANRWTGWWDEVSRGRVWRDQERRYQAIDCVIQVWRNQGKIPEGY